METFPAHVGFGWIGNSEAVARKHFLRVTGEHFQRAVRDNDDVSQKAAQQAHAAKRPQVQLESTAQAKAPFFRGLATTCD